jgi:hypothetical protein
MAGGQSSSRGDREEGAAEGHNRHHPRDLAKGAGLLDEMRHRELEEGEQREPDP